MTRWKWQNRQKFDKDKRRPISGRRCPAKSGLLGYIACPHKSAVHNALIGVSNAITMFPHTTLNNKLNE